MSIKDIIMMGGQNYIPGLVSVGIPAYKSKYLKETIESVLSQTYSNFELIVVNDKSPNDIDSVMAEIEDKRIRYYINEENLGRKSIAFNWNKCLEYAKGEFFVLLCDDDLIKPEFLSTLLKLAKKYPQCGIFRTRSQYWNSVTNKYFYETEEWPEYETYEEFVKDKYLGHRKHTISEFLHRTEHLVQSGGYVPFPAGFYSDDVSILKLCKEGGIVSANDKLLIYRMNEQNISAWGNYSTEKVKAALLYYFWVEENLSNYVSHELISQKLDYELNDYLKDASIKDALKILFVLVPNKVWHFKQKMTLLFRVLRHKQQ